MEKKTNMLILLKKALDEADAVVIGAGADFPALPA